MLTEVKTVAQASAVAFPERIYYDSSMTTTATVDGKIIIWNQPFTLLGGFQRTIAHLQAQAKEQGIALPILVVEVNADPQVAKKRVMSRKQQGGHGPSEATFDRFITEYVSFASEGHPTVIVQGDGNVQQSLDAVLAALREL
jgi:hypothetical protein